MNLERSELTTPLGDVQAVWHDGWLCSLTFNEYWDKAERVLTRRFRTLEWSAVPATRLQPRLDAYFGGDLSALDTIDVDPGGTDFQQAVWRALRRIPVGTTTTYGALARTIGSPAAVRAVGAANGANPIWLVIPCHRAIGSDGRLTGYAGGLHRKQWLLEHESAGDQPRLALAGA